MWHLRGRDHLIKQYTDHGDFATIADAAACILQLEGDPLGPVRFGVMADPMEVATKKADNTDAAILSDLHYRTQKAFYKLERKDR